jgi:hypothetical protein
MNIIKITLLCLWVYSGFAQLTNSDLPIVIINTQGKTIVDEPKTLVQFQIIYNGEGKTNKVTDAPNHYDSFAGVEFRGSSSQMFPKKPYGLELRNADGSENPKELLGMPKESDWILFASYNEKSLMHNVFTLQMAGKLGIYAPKTRYVELIFNDQYQGVYVFMEKIKRDKGRLDISNLKVEDLADDQLTGGYIIKIDKSTGTNLGSFTSKYANRDNNYTSYFYESPKTINNTQKQYIKSYVTKFEDAVYGPDFRDPVKGYIPLIDVGSFVKMFVVNEISRNIDGYRISSFLYKDRDSKGGKLAAGPPWDYDISYGNADYCQGNRSDLFAYKFNQICPTDYWLVPRFWDRMLDDPAFIGEMRNVYFEERKTGGKLSTENLMADIDKIALEIKDAQVRNFQKWPILGTYVWPNPQPIASTWEGEVLELKTWLTARLNWLDENMPKEFVITSNAEPEQNWRVFPNPFLDKIQIELTSKEKAIGEATLFDQTGKLLLSEKLEIVEGKNYLNIDIPQNLNIQGVTLMKIKLPSGEVIFKKLLKVSN